MYSSTQPLLKAAHILEKCAEIFEKEEIQENEKRAEELKTNYLNPIKEAAPEATDTLTEKLATLDPEVLGFIKNITSHQQETYNDSGWGEGTEKVASGDEDEDPILAFCLSED